MSAPLPEGFTLDPGSEPAAAPPPSGGLPPGFTLDQPMAGPTAPPAQAAAPLPEGFHMDETPPPQGSPKQMSTEAPKPLGTSDEAHAQQARDTEDQYPGFMNVVGSAASRKAVEATTNAMLGSQIVLPQGVGGKTLEQAYQEGKVHPKTKDKIDELLDTSLTNGWSDWRWWAAQLAGNLGGVAPGLATAGAATAVAGPLAGVAGFTGEAAVERLVPAYNAARAAGLDPDAATKRALVDSGISAAFAIAMGMAGKLPISKMVGLNTVDEITGQLKRPLMEAFLQLSAVQPGLMAGQDITTALSHGEAPNAEQVVTDMLVGGLAGYGIHRTFMGLDKVKGLVGRGDEEGASPASDETIMQAAEAQRPQGIRGQLGKLAKQVEPAAPVGPPGEPDDQSELTRQALLDPAHAAHYEQDLYPKEPNPVFYSEIQRVLEEKMPANASTEQVLGILRNSGISEEQKERAYIPAYLEDQRGQINKDDLLAHIEANMLRIKERHYSDAAQEASNAVDQFWDEMDAKGKTSLSEFSPMEKQRYRALQAALDAARRQPALEHDEPYNYLPGEQRGRSELLMYVDDPLDVAAKDWAQRNGLDWNRASAGDRTRAYRSAEREANEKGTPIPEAYTDLLHWPNVPNSVVHTRGEARTGPAGEKTYVLDEVQATGHQDARKEGYKGERFRNPAEIQRELEATTDPNRQKALANELRKAKLTDAERSVPLSLPFKTDHQELAIKRMMRWAVDSGYDELALVNGDMVGLRLNTRQQLAGARQNYDKTMPKIFKKLAKMVGATTEYRKLDDVTPEAAAQLFPMGAAARMGRYKEMGLLDKPFNQNILVMKLNPHSSGIIRSGMPYDADLTAKRGTRTLSDLVQENKMPLRLAKPAKKIGDYIRKLSNEFGISRGITFNALPMDTNWRGRLRDDLDPATGNYVIDVNTKRILTEHDLYAAMSHEFGHVIMYDKFRTAVDRDQAALFSAFRKFRAGFDPNTAMVGDVRRLRDNAISLSTGARAMHDGLRLSDLDPKSKAYFLSFEEWFAEQTAKYLQTDAKPLGVADGFFKRLANKIRKMISVFSGAELQRVSPDQAVKDFLDARWGMPGGWVEPIKEQFETDTIKKAQEAFDKEGAPETRAVPQQGSTGGGRDVVKALGLDKEGGEAMAAHADRMNWFFDKFLSLPQVQELNPHVRQLGYYTDMHRTANRQMNDIMQEAHSRVQQWGAIRDRKQQVALTKFIDDYANGFFKLPHTEDGIFRRPNAEEFAALVKKHGLSDQGVKLFQGITGDFDRFLERYRTLLVNDARANVKDPQQLQTNIENINRTIGKLLQRPFVPLSRFGKYLVTVYDSKGNIRHSEQTNSLRRQRQIVEALKKHPDRLPGDIVLPGEVPKDAAPFLGMPPGLIDLISDKLSLSPTQRGVLDQLRFDYAPGHSFKHQFRDLDLVPGYSTDFLRNYAHFFFHGARHVTRVTWGDQMRDQIKSMASDSERLARAGNRDGAVKLDKIVKFAQDHYKAWVDPKSDWAGLRGIMFHWYLGFNPASAITNLTQSPLMTYPYLASAFGDLKAAKAMLKASLDLNNFYKKGTLVSKGTVSQNTAENFMARAMGELVKRGTISETQAHQLAAISEDRNLLRNFGKGGEAAWLKFQEASSWMFEMTEQYNRRIAARAALDLAYSNPNHANVRTAIAERPVQYAELTDPKGLNWTPQEAGALLAAQRAVDKSQFDYSQYARPKVMRGPVGGTAFVFKLFTQNTMYNLMSNPAMLARWMVVMGALGGLQGMMGFENVNSLVKTLAYRLFGKDFDLEDEARGFAHDVLHDAISPDILMHGLSVKGFGIPAVMHSMGMNWAPTPDLSRSVGFGDVLGFDPFSPLGPTKNPKEEELRQIQRGAGAAFGLPMSIYDFASSNDNFTDLKKYETIAPRFLANLSHAYRFWTQGKEVNKAGNAVVRFNPADTEQMMEILARATGLQPRRLTEEYERIAATTDAANFWDLKRQGLMRQFGEALRTRDADSKQRTVNAIVKFNKDLPDFARSKSITSAQLKSSVQQRLRVQQMQESGMPAQKANVPIAREVEKYYPRGWPKDLQAVKPVQ